jgi:hypothetical protein
MLDAAMSMPSASALILMTSYVKEEYILICTSLNKGQIIDTIVH